MTCTWDRRTLWGRKKTENKEATRKSKQVVCCGGASGRIQNPEKRLVTTTQHRAKREAEAEPHRHPPWESDTLPHTLVCVPVAVHWWRVSSLSSIGVKGLWRQRPRSLTSLPCYLWENGERKDAGELGRELWVCWWISQQAHPTEDSSQLFGCRGRNPLARHISL